MNLSSMLSTILVPADRALTRIVGRGFGLKDVFTLINLAGGTAGIYLAMLGRPVDASWAVLLGFILGDSMDGFVARVTRHSNRFGSDFDTITDHLAQGIAPAFIILSHLYPINRELAVGTAFMLVAAGSIRHARNTAVSFEYKFCWKGLPRPIATMFLFSLYNSSLLWRLPYAHWWLFAATLIVAWGLLTDYPFVSHHGRKLQGWVVAIVTFAYASTILQALFYRRFVWEFLCLCMCVYIFLGWIVLHPEERREYWRAVQRWRTELEADSPYRKDETTDRKETP